MRLKLPLLLCSNIAYIFIHTNALTPHYHIIKIVLDINIIPSISKYFKFNKISVE